MKRGVVTQTALDEKGRPVRDPDSSSYTATLEPVGAFGRLIYGEARRRESNQAEQAIVLGDGAAWIWNLAAQHFPRAIEIVDLFHAREHLHDLAALAAPALGEDADDWRAARLAELDQGDINAIDRAAGDLAVDTDTADKIDKALNYFRTNRERMRYKTFREEGLFVGSGFIDSGCRAVIGQRMKQSGMRRSYPAPPESQPSAATTRAAPPPPSRQATPDHQKVDRSTNPATYKKVAHSSAPERTVASNRRRTQRIAWLCRTSWGRGHHGNKALSSRPGSGS